MEVKDLMEEAYQTAERQADALDASGIKRKWAKEVAAEYRAMKFSFTDANLVGYNARPELVVNVLQRVSRRVPGIIKDWRAADSAALVLS